MDATLICYISEKITQTQRTALNRKLNGYKDFSNKGKYNYRRKGFLDEIPNIKPHNSVIIVRKEDKNKLLRILRDYKAKVHSFDIQITHKQLE